MSCSGTSVARASLLTLILRGSMSRLKRMLGALGKPQATKIAGLEHDLLSMYPSRRRTALGSAGDAFARFCTGLAAPEPEVDADVDADADAEEEDEEARRTGRASVGRSSRSSLRISLRCLSSMSSAPSEMTSSRSRSSPRVAALSLSLALSLSVSAISSRRSSKVLFSFSFFLAFLSLAARVSLGRFFFSSFFSALTLAAAAALFSAACCAPPAPEAGAWAFWSCGSTAFCDGLSVSAAARGAALPSAGETAPGRQQTKPDAQPPDVGGVLPAEVQSETFLHLPATPEVWHAARPSAASRASSVAAGSPSRRDSRTSSALMRFFSALRARSAALSWACEMGSWS
eukprot:comp21690_c0_seq2/m.48205 comp21690_c0_seq2/g.48205  ORF comp21690_c0_seq2/g.48205 comp21690_c0_seq2/m.48205 type:complete len:345 (+) comp21690_c0_seq2:90-1124(+)